MPKYYPKLIPEPPGRDEIVSAVNRCSQEDLKRALLAVADICLTHLEGTEKLLYLEPGDIIDVQNMKLLAGKSSATVVLKTLHKALEDTQ